GVEVGKGGAAGGRPGGRRGRPGRVVAVQVVLLHDPDELRAVGGIGGVDARERGRELVRVLALGHGLPVVAAGGPQPAVIGNALREVVVDGEDRGAVHHLAALEILSRQHVAAGRAGSLDPEQVVISGGQAALAPARLLDGLGDRDRGRHAVLALRGRRPRQQHVDELLLRGGGGRGRRR